MVGAYFFTLLYCNIKRGSYTVPRYFSMRIFATIPSSSVKICPSQSVSTRNNPLPLSANKWEQVIFSGKTNGLSDPTFNITVFS